MGHSNQFGVEEREASIENEDHFRDVVGFTEAEEKKLVRKIDLFLLPTIWLMYLLSYMDRTNIGNAKIAGLQKDLHLSSTQYSISLIVFFITYVIFEVPSNMLLSRSKPSVYLPCIMILWGIVTMCMAAVKTYEQLIGLRILVGFLEAGFAPGVLLIISSWYKRSEQSKRYAVYISAAILSGAFGGLLAGAITKNLEGAHGIRGWRWLFIVEGAATAGWAIIAHFILLDFPATSPRLSEREKYVAIRRLQTEDVSAKTLEKEEPTHLQSFLKAFKNWHLYLFVVGYMTIVGSSTISYFYPTLMLDLGYTAYKAQYMTVPIYAVAFVCTLVTGYFCDKIPNYRGFVISCWLLLATTSYLSLSLIPPQHTHARYALIVLTASGHWSSNALSLSFAASTFGPLPPEVRGISLAVVNAMGNLASIYGAFLFPSQDAPRYVMAFGVLAGMGGVGVVTYGVAQVVVRRGKGV